MNNSYSLYLSSGNIRAIFLIFSDEKELPKSSSMNKWNVIYCDQKLLLRG